jgi:hypothetical protein
VRERQTIWYAWCYPFIAIRIGIKPQITTKLGRSKLALVAGERPKDQEGILQGQELQEAHSTQGYSVQNWQS